MHLGGHNYTLTNRDVPVKLEDVFHVQELADFQISFTVEFS